MRYPSLRRRYNTTRGSRERRERRKNNIVPYPIFEYDIITQNNDRRPVMRYYIRYDKSRRFTRAAYKNVGILYKKKIITKQIRFDKIYYKKYHMTFEKQKNIIFAD